MKAPFLVLLLSTTILLPFTRILATPLPLSKRTISQTTFDSLLRASKLSRAAYESYTSCPRPANTIALSEISDLRSDINGYISIDSARSEIVVAFRGTSGLRDVIIDLKNTLVPWTSPGSNTCTGGCRVHSGFQEQWNSVASSVITRLRGLLSQNPGYKITVTGHSLGGALATLAGITLEKTFPGSVTVYSLASPRVGNPAFVSFVEAAFPDGRIYRVTNEDDNVPQDLTPAEGYRHHKTEYWIRENPVTVDSVVVCQGGEDLTCNRAVAEENAGVGGINSAHFVYMGLNYREDEAECT